MTPEMKPTQGIEHLEGAVISADIEPQPADSSVSATLPIPAAALPAEMIPAPLIDTPESDTLPETINGSAPHANSHSPFADFTDVTNPVILATLNALPELSTEDGSRMIVLEPGEEELRLLEDLFEVLPETFGPEDYELVLRAYVVGSYAHRNQHRKSGEPYITHPLNVTIILAELLGMDAATLASGLMHDVVEDTDFDVDYIKDYFGDEVATMIDGVTKLKKIKQLSNVSQGIKDEKAESLRKMFLAMVEDIRVVIIKLADRLHNMRTLDSQQDHKKRRIARETLDIFAPLANRLGIWQLKWELEDISFQFLEPNTFGQITKAMQQKRAERERWVAEITETLEQSLATHGIIGTVNGRPKHIYSIWRKMERKGVDFDQIYDVHGFRVMVEDIPKCYAALGIVHSLWRPIPGEFDDYIASPKDNMYRSLHTAVVGPSGRPMEVQIRTVEMHQFAEYGIAAHWRYKEQTRHDQQFEEKIAWLRQLMEWRQDVSDASEFVDSMKTDVFKDRVYVFTPQGEVMDLAAGSTPIDFAYAIHTDIGHRCRGAKVDGRIVPLDYKLKNSEQVEIISAKRGGPTRDWLNPNLEYVATQRARSKIRSWLRKQNREENIRQGRHVLEREMRRLAVDEGMEELAHLFNFEDPDTFLAAIGYGDVNSQQIAQRLFDYERRQKEASLAEAGIADGLVRNRTQHSNQGSGVYVQGFAGMMTQPGKCCGPAPGDPIVGYITKGRGVTVHRTSCPNIASRVRTGNDQRLVEVQWASAPEETYLVDVQITAYDRVGLLRDFSSLVADEKINMPSVDVLTGQKDNVAQINATLAITDVAQLTRILTKIDRLPNVIESRRRI